MASSNLVDIGFELGEDRPANLEARKRQEAKWAGAQVDARQHFSAREATQEHQSVLQQAMKDYELAECLVKGLYQEQCPLSGLKEVAVRAIAGFALLCIGGELLFDAISLRRRVRRPSKISSSQPFFIHARMRPSSEDEARELLAVKPVVELLRRREGDECPGENTGAAEDLPASAPSVRQSFVLCHDGKLSRSGRRLMMHHRCFFLDKVWGPKDANPLVCGTILRPLIERAMAGKRNTVILYGQTGTGKTHTLQGCLVEISQALATLQRQVQVTFTEVQGKKCFDLMNSRKELRLLADERGAVHARGATQVDLLCTKQEDLVEALAPALALRSSLATERNRNSSRSHAVCSIYFPPTPLIDEDTEGGKVTLVDLAGSEQRWETMTMSGKDHRESANIHMALSTLKQCFRMYHDHLSNPKIRRSAPAYPYRNSALTRVLRDSFVDGSDHRTVIVACVSPVARDMLHTLNTLENVVLMSPTLERLQSATTVEVPMAGQQIIGTPVHEWSHDQVIRWVSTVQGGKFAHVVLPPKIDGWGLLNLNKVTLADLFHTETQAARAAQEGEAWTVGLDQEGGDGGDQTGVPGASNDGGPGAVGGGLLGADGGGGASAPPTPRMGGGLSRSSRAYYESLGRELYLALRNEQQEINNRLLDQARLGQAISTL